MLSEKSWIGRSQQDRTHFYLRDKAPLLPLLTDDTIQGVQWGDYAIVVTVLNQRKQVIERIHFSENGLFSYPFKHLTEYGRIILSSHAGPQHCVIPSSGGGYYPIESDTLSILNQMSQHDRLFTELVEEGIVSLNGVV